MKNVVSGFSEGSPLRTAWVAVMACVVERNRLKVSKQIQ